MAKEYPCEWAKETPRIRDLVEDTRLFLKSPNPIQIAWVNTTGSVGRAVFRGMKPYVEFSIILWPYITHEERDATVKHEVCHIAAWEFTPVEDRDRLMRTKGGHGDLWEQLMWKCELDPDLNRYSKTPVPTHVLNRRHVYCKCGAHQVTEAKFASILTRSKVFKCPRCKQPLRIKK